MLLPEALAGGSDGVNTRKRTNHKRGRQRPRHGAGRPGSGDENDDSEVTLVSPPRVIRLSDDSAKREEATAAAATTAGTAAAAPDNNYVERQRRKALLRANQRLAKRAFPYTRKKSTALRATSVGGDGNCALYTFQALLPSAFVPAVTAAQAADAMRGKLAEQLLNHASAATPSGDRYRGGVSDKPGELFGQQGIDALIEVVGVQSGTKEYVGNLFLVAFADVHNVVVVTWCLKNKAQESIKLSTYLNLSSEEQSKCFYLKGIVHMPTVVLGGDDHQVPEVLHLGYEGSNHFFPLTPTADFTEEEEEEEETEDRSDTVHLDSSSSSSSSEHGGDDGNDRGSDDDGDSEKEAGSSNAFSKSVGYLSTRAQRSRTTTTAGAQTYGAGGGGGGGNDDGDSSDVDDDYSNSSSDSDDDSDDQECMEEEGRSGGGAEPKKSRRGGRWHPKQNIGCDAFPAPATILREENEKFKNCQCVNSTACDLARGDTDLRQHMVHQLEAWRASAKEQGGIKYSVSIRDNMKNALKNGLTARADAGTVVFSHSMSLGEGHTVCVATWRDIWGEVLGGTPRDETVRRWITERVDQLKSFCNGEALDSFSSAMRAAPPRPIEQSGWRNEAALSWLDSVAFNQGEQLPNEVGQFMEGKGRRDKKQKTKNKNVKLDGWCPGHDSEEEGSDGGGWRLKETWKLQTIMTRIPSKRFGDCATCLLTAEDPVTCPCDPAPTAFFPLHPSCALCGCPACPSAEDNELHDRRSATVIIPYYSRKDVYDQYSCDFLRHCQTEEKPLSEVHFRNLWKEQRSHVKVTRVKKGWAKCDECIELRKSIQLAGTSTLRARYWACYEEHLVHQRKQRLKYYKHREKGIDRPDKYLSMILDAMDQRKTEIPNLMRQSKSVESALKLRQKLMGALVHGIGMYLYLLSPPLKGGGNFSAHALVETLKKVGEHRESQGQTYLPPTLYLQLDNASDNKCRAMLALCDALVTQGVFKKIKVSFLIVGHTHEDVDQYFR